MEGGVAPIKSAWVSSVTCSIVLARVKISLAVILGLVLVVPGGANDAHGAAPHRWVLYSGRTSGLRIGFELNGRRLAPAFFSIPVACTGGPRTRRDYFVEFNMRHFPIRVDRQGNFHRRESRLETYEDNFEEISGHVTARKIEGKIAVSFTQPARVGNEECHSGKHPHGPMEELSFRASRHRSRP